MQRSFLYVIVFYAIFFIVFMGKRSRKVIARQDLRDSLFGISTTTVTLARTLDVIRRKRPNAQQLRTLSRRQNVERDLHDIFQDCGAEEPIVLELTKALGDAWVFRWPVASVPKYLGHVIGKYDRFRAVFSELYARKPCTYDRPWRFVLGFDEFTPGAVLRQANERKCWTFVLGIIDLGPSILQHIGGWVPLAALRSNVAKYVKGGFSNVGGNLLRQLDVLCNGFVLQLAMGEVLIFLKFDGPLADGAALQYWWNWKGAGALQPCFNCKVVYLEEGIAEAEMLLAHDRTGALVDIRENDVRRFSPMSIATKLMHVDVLAILRGNTSNDAFEEVEQSYGLSYNEDSLLSMPDLRETLLDSSGNRYDSMHCVYGHGIAETEFSFLLQALSRLPNPILTDDFFTICQAAWKGPMNTERKLPGIFSEARRKHFRANKTFNCGASDMLALIPIVLYFIESSPDVQEHMPLQLASWRALEFVSRLIARGKLGIGTPAALADALQAHGVAYTAAYGGLEKAFAPKFHWLKHIPEQLAIDKFILDLFAQERFNIVYKAAADPVKNTSGKKINFERTVLERVWMQMFEYVDKVQLDGLDGGITHCPELGEGVSMSLNAVVMGTRLSEGDIVFLESNAALLIDGFLQSPHGLFFVGRHLDFLAPRCSIAAHWTPQRDVSTVKVPKLLRLAPLWCFEDHGILIFYA